MDTSKKYYESFMLGFQTYGRGRTLEQYCRDEGADFKWMEKAKEQYGLPSQTKTTPAKSGRKAKSKTPDMIKLHFEDNPVESNALPSLEDEVGTEKPKAAIGAQPSAWCLTSLRLTTPSGHEVEIKASNPSAVSELLAKLSA